MSRPWELWELDPPCYWAAHSLRDCPDQQGPGARRVDPYQGEFPPTEEARSPEAQRRGLRSAQSHHEEGKR